MDNIKRVLIVIPARKGSSFKGKNLYPCNNIPLIDYTLESSRVNYPHDTIISTNCEFISSHVTDLNFKLDLRSEKLSNDKATLDSVMLYMAEKYPLFDTFVCLPPTSPLRNRFHVEEALAKYLSEHADSLISVVPEYKSIWSSSDERVRPLVERTKNRQDSQPVYICNGAIFITSKEILLKVKRRMGGRVSLYSMKQEDSVDVHNLDDIKLAEYYLTKPSNTIIGAIE